MPENLRETLRELQKAAEYYINENDIKALQTAISKLDLLEKVGEVMPKKKECYDHPKPDTFNCSDCDRYNFYNQAIDLCTAVIAKKLEGLEKVIQETTGCENYINDSCNVTNKDITLAIRQHILGKE